MKEDNTEGTLFVRVGKRPASSAGSGLEAGPRTSAAQSAAVPAGMLSTCPWCGNEPESEKLEFGMWILACVTSECPMQPRTPPMQTLGGAFAVWNDRATTKQETQDESHDATNS